MESAIITLAVGLVGLAGALVFQRYRASQQPRVPAGERLPGLQQVQASPKMGKGQKVSDELEELSVVLSGLAGMNVQEARKQLNDAKIHVGHVLSAAAAVGKQATEYGHWTQVLDEALTAMEEQDRRKMSRCAGEIIWDLNLQELLLCDVPFENGAFWDTAHRLVSSQLGGYTAWGRAYEDYSAALLGRVAVEKGRIQRLSAMSDFVASSGQLVSIQKKLEQASDHLRIDLPTVRHRVQAALPQQMLLLDQ